MSKKTETLEVRICPDLKARLSDHCKDRNQPMSAVIRGLVEGELSGFASQPNSSKDIMMAFHPTRSLRGFALSGAALIGLGLIWNTVTHAPATAQASARITFAEMDLDEDGVITRDEYARFETQEDAIEEDFIAAEEIPPVCVAEFEAMEESPDDEDWFAYFDHNKDGKIVFGEVQTKISHMLLEEFTGLDADQDGFLSKAEFQSRMDVVEIIEEEGLSEACFAALAEQLPGASELAPDDLKIEFAALDANRDSRISQSEFLAN